MSYSHFVAVLHATSEGYGVSFPDLPGLVSVGANAEEALRNAADGATFHVSGLIEQGEAVPAPRSLDALRDDPEFAVDFDGAIVAFVAVALPDKAVASI